MVRVPDPGDSLAGNPLLRVGSESAGRYPIPARTRVLWGGVISLIRLKEELHGPSVIGEVDQAGIREPLLHLEGPGSREG
jgi:hypothetical protein